MTKRSRRLFVEQLEAREVLSTFFVATTGNDAAAGSSSAPWQSLQHAVNSAQAGDIIEVESGTYAGCRIGNSGTASAPITLEAAPGAQVIVDAPGAGNYHGSDIEVENFNGTVSNWILTGLQVENAPTYGIDVRVTQNITVENCVVHNNGRSGIFLAFSDHPLIQSNTSYDNGEHGIYDSNSGDYPTIRGNTSYGNHDSGIQLNGDVNDGGDGIITGGLIERNTIYANGAGGGSGINLDGVQGTKIQDNLLYGNLASGISLFQIDGGGPSEGNIVVDNTIIQPVGSRWALNIQNGAIDNTALDNILLNAGTNSGAIDISSDSLPGFVSNHNVVSNAFTTDDSTVISLAQWKSATGQDANSLVATPAALFANAGSNNYQLVATSPAVGEGTATDSPSYDINGNPRPTGNRYDAGAYQYEAGATSGITLKGSRTQSTYGQSVTFTATITTASGTAAGSVTFMSGSKKLGTATIANGAASLAYALLPAGADSVTAVWTSLTSAAATDTVAKATTTDKLSVSPATGAAAGKLETLTATLAPVAPGGGTIGGTVTFFDGSKVIGSSRLVGGVATIQVGLSAGSHSLSSEWYGDSNNDGSKSSAAAISVAPAVTVSTAVVDAAMADLGVKATPPAVSAASAAILTVTTSPDAPGSAPALSGTAASPDFVPSESAGSTTFHKAAADGTDDAMTDGSLRPAI
jgi:parallel beta-helix repeat protein